MDLRWSFHKKEKKMSNVEKRAQEVQATIETIQAVKGNGAFLMSRQLPDLHMRLGEELFKLSKAVKEAKSNLTDGEVAKLTAQAITARQIQAAFLRDVYKKVTKKKEKSKEEQLVD